ncbi:MAG: hypothetical protein AB1766_07420 [Pseudomonadota bacterium]
MPASAWEFEEALECFSVIESSLRCIYAGEIHMYRALSAQLRILLCDSPKPLLVRLFSNLELQSLEPAKSYEPGSFPPELKHLNAIGISGSGPMAVSCMPFEARIFFNGIEDCRPLLSSTAPLLPIDAWVDQVVSVHPVPVTVRQVIKTVADRGGGAHVHKSKDALLAGLQGLAPGKLHLAALVIIAISKVMQQLGLSVVQLYEKSGPKGGLPLEHFDDQHPTVLASARVPAECLKHPYQAINLLSVGPV